MGRIYQRKDNGQSTKYWYLDYEDHNGKRIRECTKTRDKATAKQILASREADVAKLRSGIIDPSQLATSQELRRPVAEHIEAMINSMQTQGRSETHIAKTERHIRTIAEYAGAKTLNGITAEKVEKFAVEQKAMGRSARTIQQKLTAIKQFTNWCVKTNRLPADPLRYVKKPSPKSDRRLKRRMILQEEWHWLIKATSNGAMMKGLSSEERCLLYRTAIATGFRANELAHIEVAMIHERYIALSAEYTKNRQVAKQYISKALSHDLRTFCKRESRKGKVFRLNDLNRLSDILRSDMAAAKALYVQDAVDDVEKSAREQSSFLAPRNEQKEELTFHSLRHTCGAWLLLANSPIMHVQKVMRHSTITLTIDTYGHLTPMIDESAGNILGNILDAA